MPKPLSVDTLIKKLNLLNINVIHARIEDFQKDNKEIFTYVTARALSKLDNLINYALPFLIKRGKMIFLKSLSEIENNLDDVKTKYRDFCSVSSKNNIVFAEKLV